MTAARFSLIAPQASANAARTDALFLAMLVVCGVMAVAIATLIVVFSIRYRRGARADRSHAPSSKLPLEIGWTVTPLLIFVGVFAWSTWAYVRTTRTPADALPVYVVAKQWMWKLQQAGGRREINELHVPIGEPVRLVMTSQDVIHSFYVPAFRLKQDVVPGRYTTLSFTATRLGEFHLFCAEYCGSEHSAMLGRIVVMTPTDFSRWLAAGKDEPGLAERGFALYRSHGCSGCHEAGSTVHAPSLDALIGRTVHLQDGRSVVADENYVRDSILLPLKDVVAGFDPVMPSFAGQLDEEQIEAIVAYIRSTGNRPGTRGGRR
ncbi:MAG TPA: cytochrome c oxidase subunit II [Caldimonas sp.]|nr:cytochrome c oxidase subunit II [Caldimonas sp.]